MRRCCSIEVGGSSTKQSTATLSASSALPEVRRRTDPSVYAVPSRRKRHSARASDGRRRRSTAVTYWPGNDTASLPLLADPDSVAVFARLGMAPRISQGHRKSWFAKPARNETETTDREFFDFDSCERPDGWWPVLKGESFEIWNLRERQNYAFANPGYVLPWLQEKRLRSQRRSTSGTYSDFDREYVRRISTLPLPPS